MTVSNKFLIKYDLQVTNKHICFYVFDNIEIYVLSNYDVFSPITNFQLRALEFFYLLIYIVLRESKIKRVLHIFDRLTFHYFLQLIFRLTPLASAAKSSEKLCNNALILDALQLVCQKGFFFENHDVLWNHNCYLYFFFLILDFFLVQH